MQIKPLLSLFRVKFVLCLLITTSSSNSAMARHNDVAAPEPRSVTMLRRSVENGEIGSRMKVDESFRKYCIATAPEHRRQLEKKLLSSKRDDLPFISEKLERGSKQEKIHAIKLIPTVHWTGTEPILTKLLSDANEDELVRVGACYALSELGFKKASPLLLDQLKKTRSVQMRRASLLALGNLKDPNYSEAIKPYQGDSDDLVSLYAEVALARMGKLKGKPNTAIKLSESNDWAIRSEAIRALGSIGGKDAIEKLKGIAEKHPLPGVKLAARQAIEKAKLVGMNPGKSVEYIRSKLKEDDIEIQVWAMNIAAKELGEEGLNILKEKAEESGEIGETAGFYYEAHKQDKGTVEPP